MRMCSILPRKEGSQENLVPASSLVVSFSRILCVLLLSFSIPSFSQSRPKVVSLEQLQNLYIQNNDTTYVVNFWATWCVPCVEEMPFIEQITKDYKDQKVKVILACMDDPKHTDSRVMPYLEKEDIQSHVVLFDEPKPNRWIPLINPDWSGAIPATIVRKDSNEEFYEKKFEEGELERILKGILGEE